MSKNAQITNFVNKCKFDLVTSKSKQISKKAGKKIVIFKRELGLLALLGIAILPFLTLYYVYGIMLCIIHSTMFHV